MKYLADSVILIDHFNGIDLATEWISNHYSDIAVSVITRAELLTGFDEESVDMIGSLLDRFQTLIVDREVADLAARMRMKHRWKLPDTFQAALARLHGLTLVTRNTKDFSPDRFDFVEVPYRI